MFTLIPHIIKWWLLLTNNVDDLFKKVESISNTIQEKGYIDGETFKKLEEEVDELKEIVATLDKELAVNVERQTPIYIQLERLDEKVKELAESTKDKDDKKSERVEKVLLLVLGAIVSFVFNKFT